MKKILSIILLTTMLVNLVGCTGGNAQKDVFESQGKTKEDTVIVQDPNKDNFQENSSNASISSNQDVKTEMNLMLHKV